MALAVVRSLGAPRRLGSVEGEADYEQELVDQYLLASVGAGYATARSAVTGASCSSSSGSLVVRCGLPSLLTRFGFLAAQRKSGRAYLTVQK